MERNSLSTWTFLGLTAALSILSALAPARGFSQSENRYLQKRPKFTMQGFLDGSFGKEYEAYLSDQFPGREGWIGLKVFAEYLEGKRDINGVYLGRDGYLLERFEAEAVEGEQLDDNLLAAADFGARMAGLLGEDRVRLLLVPSASQVLTEKLPAFAAPYDQSRITDRLKEALCGEAGFDQNALSQLVVPAEEALKESREEGLYYRTDHHWTAKGAYVSYQAWAKSLGLEPWEKEDFVAEQVSGDFHGTIYSKLNIPWQTDSIEAYFPAAGGAYRVSFDGEEQGFDSLYFYEALKTRDQYRFYLDGNHGLTKIENQSGNLKEKDRKLLIVKDSFANAFAPFAVNHFGTVYLVDLRYFNGNLSEWVEKEQVTDVLLLYQIPGFAKEKTVSKLRW